MHFLDENQFNECDMALLYRRALIDRCASCKNGLTGFLKAQRTPHRKEVASRKKMGFLEKKALMGKRDPHWKERLGKEKGAPMGKEWFVWKNRAHKEVKKV